MYRGQTFSRCTSFLTARSHTYTVVAYKSLRSQPRISNGIQYQNERLQIFQEEMEKTSKNRAASAEIENLTIAATTKTTTI